VRCCLLGNVTGAHSVACLQATPQGEMRERNQPFRQDGEGLPAWMTDPTADPNAVMLVIVRLPQSPSVTNDRLITAKWAQPREQMKRNHPGSMLSGVSANAIKRITAGVKARR
jgi:hypothetical protein